MKTLYLDCSMGAAGDMLAGALLELLPDPDGFLGEVNALGLPGVRVRRERAVRCGITGTRVAVTVDGVEEESLDHGHDHHHEHEHDHEHDHDHDHEQDHDHEHDHEHDHDHGHGHSHSGMGDIEGLVRSCAALPPRVQEDVLAVYGLIAQAESAAHGVSVREVHFHEVGALDAVADITMVCLLLDRLAPEEIVASPVRLGYGQVRCAHGILPVPAPATASILRDVPVYAGDIQGELCTPTGAALLRHFAARFEPMPPMRVSAVGYGCGKKEFPAANCVRAMLGSREVGGGEILELSCCVDDMTGEELGFALERLLEGGALDAYTLPAGMKKSRPGVLLQVLCRPEDRDGLLELMFRHTTTLGVREAALRRHTLERRTVTADTPWGSVRRKDASGFGVTRSKYEFEDLAALARTRGLSLREAAALLDGKD